MIEGEHGPYTSSRCVIGEMLLFVKPSFFSAAAAWSPVVLIASTVTPHMMPHSYQCEGRSPQRNDLLQCQRRKPYMAAPLGGAGDTI
ncbi:hypothetical protein [Novosphingobium sp. HII-3]|uniref:hypothetical protein n=1 Tax=Novosphingobium sp. HII-3 TaxID=2075565 RepID=UPI00130490CB|nr:hypothetical protein [Novosphingobium sp. HII-3]